MARIRVTGYLNTEDLAPDMLDLTHPSGLSTTGYEAIFCVPSEWKLSDLEDEETELEEG